MQIIVKFENGDACIYRCLLNALNYAKPFSDLV